MLSVETPLWLSDPLGRVLGTRVLLKMEAFQPSGSFKARGMGAACLAARDAGATAVVSSSGGNAGYVVAYAARQLGLAATIVVPETTAPLSRGLIESQGARLIVHGAAWDDAHAHALELARGNGARYVHPFDDADVWRGHAEIVHELARAHVKPGALVVAVGGGGLLIGLVEGMREHGWHDVPVLAVETEGAASFAESVRTGQLVTLDRIASLATTLGARRVAPRALELASVHPIEPYLVSDRDAVEACLRFADDHRVLVEPSCGAGLAAVYQRAPGLVGRDPVVVIVCGGVGVSRELLARWTRDVGIER